MLIAKYTANASGVVPTFNSGYQYTKNETVSDGIYTVELNSDTDFTSCSFKSKSNLLTVEYLKVTNKVTNMAYMFQDCSQLTQLDASNWGISNVMNMNGMFRDCSSLTQLDVSNWDTSKVTTMNSMFRGCSSLTQLDLSDWVTNKVQSMNYVFQNCSQLTQLNVSNLSTTSLLDNTDTFGSCSSLNDVIATNVSTSTLSKLITLLPTRTSESYGTIKVANTTDKITSSANVKYWNIKVPMLVAKYTANVSGVLPTFNDGYQYTINETESNGVYTVELYSDTDFTSCSFNGKSNLLTVEYLKVTSSVTTMQNMFNGCSSLTQLDVSNWDTSQVTKMNNTFRSCSSLAQLDLSNWDTKNLKNISAMFHTCSGLTQLDLSNFDTSSITSMINTFSNCSQLTRLDLSNWDTNKVTDMGNMFSNCPSLNKVIATNVSTSTLSTLVTVLPTRTSDSYGTINATNKTDEITSSANAKYWNIKAPMLIARYTANASGVLPTFNDGYQYIINETESNGIYTVEIKSEDDFTSCSFNGKSNLLTVEYLNVTSSITDMSKMFRQCSKLTQLDVSNWDTKNVTTMASMFYGCSQLTQLDASNWDTSKVTAMTYMFCDCSSFTQLDASNWVTSSVTRMNNMFQNCSQLTQLDVSNFDTSEVTITNAMFSNCSQLTQLDLSNWDTSKVTDVGNMFRGCSQLTQLDVSNWDTSGVKDMSNMFNSCTQLTQLDVSNWVTSKVTTMNYMFQDCSSLAQLDVSNWDTSNVPSMTNMFYDCSSLNYVTATNVSASTLSTLVTVLPTRTSDSYGTIKVANTTDEITSSANVKYWNIKVPMLVAKYTANVSGVLPTFNDGYQYTINETESNGVYTVELYSDTDFTSCSFNGSANLSTVEYLKVTSSVTDMSNMFRDCSQLTQLDVSNWDTKNVTNMSHMLRGCSQLTQLDVSNWDISSVTDISYMFYYCSQLTQLDLSNWDTSSVIIMSWVFTGCDLLTSIGDVSNWDTRNVSTTKGMFQYCSSLTQLVLSNWDTKNVTNMKGMFQYCSSLTQLDLSNWDTSKVTDMSNMFAYCSQLTQLDLSNFNTKNVLSSDNMFQGCVGLFDVGLIYSDIDTLNLLPTLDTMALYVGTHINQSQYTGVSKLKEYREKRVNINIPVDLKGNGDVVDRLYWNDEDKHYYIEQWIDSLTGEILETPNIIATSITTPIEIKQFTNVFTIDIENLTPSYLNITTPHYYIPDDYEYKEEEEVEYFKQSFELRFPNADDVGEDWGFAHVEGDYSMGLKRVIDWVDNCDDETFVRDFDKYFHRQYTLRYFLLAITLG